MNTSNLDFEVIKKVCLHHQFINCCSNSLIFLWVGCPSVPICLGALSDYICCPGLILIAPPFTLKCIPVWKKYGQVWIINNKVSTLMSIAMWLLEPNRLSRTDKSSSWMFKGNSRSRSKVFTAACRQPLFLPLLSQHSGPAAFSLLPLRYIY